MKRFCESTGFLVKIGLPHGRFYRMFGKWKKTGVTLAV
jgi:hypothetical protein